MKLQTRIQIGFLLLIVLVVLSAVFIAAWRLEGVITCPHCGTQQTYIEKSYWVMGLEWEEESHGEIEPSPLCRDFPDYPCDHSWEKRELNSRTLWPNPLILRPFYCRGSMAENALAKHYNQDALFRGKLSTWMDKGTVTREHWLSRVALNCMDSGVCSLMTEDPQDKALLELLDSHQLPER